MAARIRHRCWQLALCTSLICNASNAATFSVLHVFQGSDGDLPIAALTIDKSGNLWGTASGGPRRSTGVVFELSLDGREQVLHRFAGRHDGLSPESSSLILDGSGNLLGTTITGGKAIGATHGTIFSIAPDGTENLLYIFHGKRDGHYPRAGLTADKLGNLYGTTPTGGARGGCPVSDDGCGTVFRLSADGQETILHRFVGADGAIPVGGALLLDDLGNLYGTAYYGGRYDNCIAGGCGTVFKISPDGDTTVLYEFKGGADGSGPQGSLISDGAGNLYGTTYYGGRGACDGGCGTLFKLAPDGTETVLHTFRGRNDGKFPIAGLIRDAAGNLYGTAFAAGDAQCHGGYGCGTVFELVSNGAFEVLHTFVGTDGANPVGTLVADGVGNLYGTTENGGGAGCGGGGCGTVFKLTPD